MAENEWHPGRYQLVLYDGQGGPSVAVSVFNLEGKLTTSKPTDWPVNGPIWAGIWDALLRVRELSGGTKSADSVELILRNTESGDFEPVEVFELGSKLDRCNASPSLTPAMQAGIFEGTAKGSGEDPGERVIWDAASELLEAVWEAHAHLSVRARVASFGSNRESGSANTPVRQQGVRHDIGVMEGDREAVVALESLELAASEKCPYCQSEVPAKEAAKRCSECGAPHHADCWRENGGCTTYGCRMASTPEPSPVSRFSGLSIPGALPAAITLLALYVALLCTGVRVGWGLLACAAGLLWGKRWWRYATMGLAGLSIAIVLTMGSSLPTHKAIGTILGVCASCSAVIALMYTETLSTRAVRTSTLIGALGITAILLGPLTSPPSTLAPGANASSHVLANEAVILHDFEAQWQQDRERIEKRFADKLNAEDGAALLAANTFASRKALDSAESSTRRMLATIDDYERDMNRYLNSVDSRVQALALSQSGKETLLRELHEKMPLAKESVAKQIVQTRRGFHLVSRRADFYAAPHEAVQGHRWQSPLRECQPPRPIQRVASEVQAAVWRNDCAGQITIRHLPNPPPSLLRLCLREELVPR